MSNNILSNISPSQVIDDIEKAPNNQAKQEVLLIDLEIDRALASPYYHYNMKEIVKLYNKKNKLLNGRE